MSREAIQRALRGAVRGEVRFDEPLSRHTTLRVGGPADAWVEPADAADLRALLAACHAGGIPCRALGIGSNLLVRDGGLRGVSVSMRRVDRLERVGPHHLRVQAGLGTARLLATTLDAELGGLEFLAGVPGTVGGGLVMNAGTYLGEFKDVTMEVGTLAPDGREIVRAGAQCGFAYRTSAIPRDEIVLWGHFALKHRARADIEHDVRELRARRRAREPRGLPNAGSFFKNPPGEAAGRLIERAGLKGRTVGGAQVSPVHANWLVNVGDARAADFLALAAIVRDEVRVRSGIDLELEVRVIGEEAAREAR